MLFSVALLVLSNCLSCVTCSLYRDHKKIHVLPIKRDISTTYPPHPASCRHIVDLPEPFQKIECKAKVGFPAGSLKCYQFGKQVPPCDFPQKLGFRIFQTFSIYRHEYVHCCSESDVRPMSNTACNDWPMNDFLVTATSESQPDVSQFLTTKKNETTKRLEEILLSHLSKLFANDNAIFAWISLLTIVVMFLIAFIIYSKRHQNSQGAELQSGDGQDDEEGSNL